MATAWREARQIFPLLRIKLFKTGFEALFRRASGHAHQAGELAFLQDEDTADIRRRHTEAD